MNRPKILTKVSNSVAKVPRKVWFLGGGLFIVALYSAVFFIQKPVDFAYDTTTCVRHLLIAPDFQKSSSEDFAAIPADTTAIGPITFFSTKLCFEPQSSPESGARSVAVAPFGGPLFSKQFTLTVPEPPTARTADFIDTTIATARPLAITMSQPDTLHDYTLKANQKATSCELQDKKLSCDVRKLELDQGAKYAVELQKQFKDDTPVTVAKGDVATHVPLQYIEGSVKEGQVVYDVPKTFTFGFDKELASADAKLEKIEGDTATSLALSATNEGQSATFTIEEDLPRQSSYRLTVHEAVAKEGSSLHDPLVINFTTSGGPKVSGVSIGGGDVAASAQITVAFDQPLNESVDIAKLIRTTGVASSVRKLSPTQVALKLNGAPDCAPFTIVVDKGLKSGSNNETSAEGWSHASRITCGTSWTIGYSVRGRPIVAHSFGSGSTILFTGGIHGNEGSTVATMNAWVQYLKANAGTVIPAGKRVVIVPNTNPDGIATGSRNNVNNVNLGRNFNTANWRADIETASGVLVNGGGTAPASEPEAAALAALTRQLRPRLEASFHSQGRLVGANKAGDSVAIGDMYAKTVGYRTMFYNAEAVMGYPMTGEYEDWMGESMGIPAILIELPSHSGNYLNTQLPALKKLLTL